MTSNRDSGAEFRSLSGQAETTEPTNSSSDASTNGVQNGTSGSPISSGASSGASASTLRKSSSTALAPSSSSPAAGQSPRTSRNTSPLRKDRAPALSNTLSTQPSAAAIQRALSASSVPQLQQPGAATVLPDANLSKLPRGTKSTSASAESTPQWPLSPRVKSPPPSALNSRRGSAAAPKKPDAPQAPSIQVLAASPALNTPPHTPRQTSGESQKSEPQLQAPLSKSSSRGPSGKSMLETVQENTPHSQEPSRAAIQAATDLKPLTKIAEDESTALKLKRKLSKAELEKQPGESGSESPGSKSDNPRGRREAGTASNNSQPQRQKSVSTTTKASYPVPANKARSGDGTQNMTVETETVQSIPQSALAPAGDRSGGLRGENGGSVRLKPSNETIRPKKERKKAERKTRSVTQGTATSKADLFEARVASAVDASANGSDSDETFVYESNPPEPRRSRHHSRTPSVTSSHSLAGEQRSAIRNYGEAFDDRRIGGKRSMKFSSNPYNDHDSPESNNGTVRSHTPRHIGRFGRGGHHSANYDPDSPFTQAAKLRHSNHLAHGRSRPNSPRSPQSMQFRPGGFFSGSKKQEHPYDFDAEQNADDERQPLLSGTLRTPRHGRHLHRISGGGRDAISDEFEYQYRRKYCGCFSGKLGACILTALMLVLVVISAVFFVFASNRPLQDVGIHKIQNVLASEQELMLDLLVGAVNPNTLGISISDMDVNIFAKSKHVGGHEPDNRTEVATRRSRRKRRSETADWEPNLSQDESGHWPSPRDHGREIDTDLENSDDAQTMLLGRIFHFDQALTFEASPLTGKAHISSGQLRLAKPGNRTESGGSARWEEMILYPFELIVRGVLKYQLPISSRAQSAAVGAKVMVHPEDGIDAHGAMRVEPVDHSEHWQWVDWPEVEDEELGNLDGLIESTHT